MFLGGFSCSHIKTLLLKAIPSAPVISVPKLASRALALCSIGHLLESLSGC